MLDLYRFSEALSAYLISLKCPFRMSSISRYFCIFNIKPYHLIPSIYMSSCWISGEPVGHVIIVHYAIVQTVVSHNSAESTLVGTNK